MKMLYSKYLASRFPKIKPPKIPFDSLFLVEKFITSTSR